jgi:hypothetical protein
MEVIDVKISDKLIVKIGENYYLTAIIDKKKLKKMNIKKFKEHTDTLDITRPFSRILDNFNIRDKKARIAFSKKKGGG